MSDGASVPSIRFTPADLELFARASHDRNPLHLSASFARQTAFGSPVVFGVLGALAVIGKLRDRPASRASAIKLDFVSPLFAGIDYAVAITEESAARTRAVVRDGRRQLLKIDIRFQDGPSATLDIFQEQAGVREAKDRTRANIEGAAAIGEWAPSRGPFQQLVEAYQLRTKGLDDAQLATLLWASYLVGMELPGRRALFSRLSLAFQPAVSSTGLLQYEARVTQLHDQFGLASMQVRVARHGNDVASGEVESFVREETPKSSSSLQPGHALSNTTALVIGASRGLGAAIASSMCAEGATVHANYAQSAAEAEQLSRSTRDLPGRIVLQQGDARDARWCERMRADLESGSGLDVLVCNACPPLLPLWIELAAAERIQDHISSSIALVLAPMSALLDLLAKARGWCVVISSSSVASPIAEWPHYIAAKAALESLVRVAALEYPAVRFAIVRPPRLLTDLTNTPLGRTESLDPHVVAHELITVLTHTAPSQTERGEVLLLENFGGVD